MKIPPHHRPPVAFQSQSDICDRFKHTFTQDYFLMRELSLRKKQVKLTDEHLLPYVSTCCSPRLDVTASLIL